MNQKVGEQSLPLTNTEAEAGRAYVHRSFDSVLPSPRPLPQTTFLGRRACGLGGACERWSQTQLMHVAIGSAFGSPVVLSLPQPWVFI